MNEGKVRAPYEFPESYIQFATLWYEFFRLPYRQWRMVEEELLEERRRWIKVHVAVDVKDGKLLSLEVTNERAADPKIFKELVGNLKLKGCLEDEAYDSEEILELLEKKGVDPPPGIKLRRDAKAGLSPSR